LAFVRTTNREYYIDKTGKTVITLNYFTKQPFLEGLVPVKVGDKFGYMDKTGNIVINPQFFDVGHFSEGLAIVLY